MSPTVRTDRSRRVALVALALAACTNTSRATTAPAPQPVESRAHAASAPAAPVAPAPVAPAPEAPAAPANPAAPVNATSANPPSGPAAIAVAHVVVIYRGAQSAPAGISRSREEARARAEEALRRIRGGTSFEAAVREFSDEPGAVARGGDLGIIRRGVTPPSFERVAFGLAIDEVGGVVETPRGFHVIKRTVPRCAID